MELTLPWTPKSLFQSVSVGFSPNWPNFFPLQSHARRHLALLTFNISQVSRQHLHFQAQFIDKLIINFLHHLFYGRFSKKWYPKQTSIGYRIFYKFSNFRKGIHTKLDFRWAQIALNFLEENYAICSHPPSQIFVVWMKLPCRGKYSSETSGLQE